MKYARGLLTCLLAVGTCATAPAQTVEWVREYNGPGSASDVALAIAVDGAGNVYVGGGSVAQGGLGNEDYATVKYAPDGTPSPTWPDVGFGVGVRRYDFVNNFDRVNAIAVDEFGGVYVTGQFNPSNYDWGTLAYDAGGNLLWVATYGAPLGDSEAANHIALDGLGHVYVSGYTVLSGNTGQDYCTIKYDAVTGQPSASWPDVGFGVGVRVYDNGALSAEEVLAMVVDDSGNVYVTGRSVPHDYATIKYDAAGTEVWVARYDSGSGDAATAIALGEAGAVYVTGSGSGNYVTLKYDADGTLSPDWPDVGFGVGVRVYDGPGAGDGAVGIGIDATGHIYVTGSSNGIDTGNDFATIKYDPDGSPSGSWPDVGFGVGVRRYSSLDEFDDEPAQIAVDPAGNVYVGGISRSASNSADFAIIKYTPTGEELWVETYNAPGNGFDRLTGLRLDDAQNIYATGWGPTEAKTGDDYITIKYSQAADCEGDANGDGLVDPLDSGFVLARFGCDVGAGDPDCDTADMNGDGLVDPLDVGYILARFGTCP